MKTAIVIALLALLVIAGCETTQQSPNDVVLSGSTLNTTELKKVSSAQQLREFLLKSETSMYGGFGYGAKNSALSERSAMDASGGAPAPMVATSKSESAQDYSGTNVQIKGVDEADIVKSDGK